MRKACLRWHPDKWARYARMLEDAAEQEDLKQLSNAMFRAVTRHRERGFRNARATTGAGDVV